MLLQYSIWGVWYVTLSSYLSKTLAFSGVEIGLIYGTFAIAAIISPFLIGVLADRYFASQKLIGTLHILGGATLFFLQLQTEYTAFYLTTLIFGLFYMPTITLSNTISFILLKQPNKSFSSIRVFGTFGWIAMGWVVSLQDLEISNIPIQIGGILSIALGVYSFFLPNCPPEEKTHKKGFSSNSWVIFQNKNFNILILSSLLISIPLSFYFSFTNLFLNDLEIQKAAGLMTIGQLSEIVFLIAMPIFIKKHGLKKMILLAMLAWTVRYVFFAFGNSSLYSFLILGIALHGICYDFFFVAGQLYIHKLTPKSMQGTAQGILTLSTYGIGMLIGTWLSGLTVDFFQNHPNKWQYVWLLPALLSLAVAIFFTITFNPKSNHE